MKIAIDGPAGAGKSTIARKVAGKLGYTYIDTGAMYRAITYHLLQRGIKPYDESEVCREISTVNLELVTDENGSFNSVILNGNDVTQQIRDPEVTENVSMVSSYRTVREAMVFLQQRIAKDGNVVMDGRDIGTIVMPDAEVKVFLQASVSERARRRSLELIRKGHVVDMGELEQQIKTRDLLDSTRVFSPLRKAADAVEIDTTEMSVADVVALVVALCRRREVHV